MLQYCRDKWLKNAGALHYEFETSGRLSTYTYKDLIKLVTIYILNDGEDLAGDWDAERIHEIDDGEYQGTLIYLIPTNSYQPDAGDYLMTWIEYGSCSVCDILESIQSKFYIEDDLSKENKKEIIDDYMALCRTMVVNFTKPYNSGWNYRGVKFEEVKGDI